MIAEDVIIKPVLSEKSTQGVSGKRYAFIVDPRADKKQIKAAVEQAFGVSVDTVNIVNVPGKPKRQGRTSGYTAARKKAYVTLTAASKAIPFFETLS